MTDMVYEDVRSDRSSVENLRPHSVKCRKTVFSHKESEVVNCHKLIEDFRFLLQSEFYELATTSFRMKCSEKNNLTYNSNSSYTINIEGTSQNLSESFSNPRIWEMATTQLRPGTMIKMLFTQIEQNMRKFALQDRSQIFHRNYSKLVKPFLIIACANRLY